MDLRETGCEGLDWIQAFGIGSNKRSLWTLWGTFGFHKGRTFFGWLCNYGFSLEMFLYVLWM